MGADQGGPSDGYRLDVWGESVAGQEIKVRRHTAGHRSQRPRGEQSQGIREQLSVDGKVRTDHFLAQVLIL